MKKFLKVTFCVVTIMMVLLSTFSIVGYCGNESKDTGAKMTYINSYSAQLDKGTVSSTSTAKITGKSGVTSVKIKMELQKLSSGTYSTIQTWEQTFSGTSGYMQENKLTSLLSTYRLKVTFTAYSGSASETKTMYVYE